MPRKAGPQRLLHRKAVAASNTSTSWFNPPTEYWTRNKLADYLTRAYVCAAVAATSDDGIGQLLPKIQTVLLHIKPGRKLGLVESTSNADHQRTVYALKDVLFNLAKAADHLPDTIRGVGLYPVLAAWHAFALGRLVAVEPDAQMLSRTKRMPPQSFYPLEEGEVLPPRVASRRREREQWAEERVAEWLAKRAGAVPPDGES